jgi:hypothetical protein
LGLLEVDIVVGAVAKLFKFTGTGPETKPKTVFSAKPADGVPVVLEIRT